MNPPTEQLIRDYLNELAGLARDRLGYQDRQALLDQARARIDAACGGSGDLTADQVREALASLGDPAGLVDAEQARIARQASLADREVPGHADVAGTALVAAAGSGPGEDPGALSGRVPWPRSPGAPGFLEAPVPPGEGEGDWPTDPSAEPQILEAALAGGGEAEFSTAVRPQDGRGAAGALLASAGDAAATALGGLGSRFQALGARLAVIARRNKLEAVATVVLGLGGAVYPPLWLLGAAIALPSRIWDMRDKWLGIALPVLFVVVGTAMVIIFGGPHRSLGGYAFEAWVGAGRLCRLMAVLGAAYLLWRLHRGRRRQKLPPWNIPRKLDL